MIWRIFGIVAALLVTAAHCLDVVQLGPYVEGSNAPATLEVYPAPDPSKPSKALVIILPGGAYHHLSDKEGSKVALDIVVAKWRMASIVLSYEVMPAYPHNPIDNVAETIRYVDSFIRGKDKERELNLQPLFEIGLVGFSAGGHAAALFATTGIYPVKFLVLCYPVISMDPIIAHENSSRNLLGDLITNTHIRKLFSAELHVGDTGRFPLFTYIWTTRDDAKVPFVHAVRMYQAIIAQRTQKENTWMGNERKFRDSVLKRHFKGESIDGEDLARVNDVPLSVVEKGRSVHQRRNVLKIFPKGVHGKWGEDPNHGGRRWMEDVFDWLTKEVLV